MVHSRGGKQWREPGPGLELPGRRKRLDVGAPDGEQGPGTRARTRCVMAQSPRGCLPGQPTVPPGTRPGRVDFAFGERSEDRGERSSSGKRLVGIGHLPAGLRPEEAGWAGSIESQRCLSGAPLTRCRRSHNVTQWPEPGKMSEPRKAPAGLCAMRSIVAVVAAGQCRTASSGGAVSLRRCLLLDPSRISRGGGGRQVAGSCSRPETSCASEPWRFQDPIQIPAIGLRAVTGDLRGRDSEQVTAARRVLGRRGAER